MSATPTIAVAPASQSAAVGGAARNAVPAGATGASSALQPASTTQPTTQSSSILQTFLAQPAVRQHFHSAVGRFLSARKLLKDQERSLAKLKSACALSGLPKSMRLDIVTRTKLPSVDGLPEFFAADVATLRQIEKDASDRVAKALTEAKERHVAHLRTAVHLQSFIENECASYQSFVQGHAQAFASASGTAASDFPVSQALAEFREALRKDCEAHVMQDVMKEQQAKEEAKQESIDDAKAQESVLAGAHNGQTIKAIANKAVLEELKKQLTPLQEKLDKLQQQRQDKEKFFPPSAQPAASASNQRARPGKFSSKERREQDQRKHGAHTHISKKQQPGQQARRQNNAGPHQAKHVHFDTSTLQHGAPAASVADSHRRQDQAPSHQREHGPAAGHKKPHAKVQSNPRAAPHAKSTPTNSGGAGAQSTPKRAAETTHMNQKTKIPKQQHQREERSVQERN